MIDATEKTVCQLVLNNFTNDSRVLKECKSLASAGYDVKVIALFDSGQAVDEVVSGVQIHRVKLWTRLLPKTRFFQVFKYLEFLSRVALRSRGYDIYHCNDLNVLPAGVLIKLTTSQPVKIVYDAHEHESERNGFSALEKRITRFLERCLINRADKVLTVSDSIANDYVNIYKIGKPRLVLNCPYKQTISPMNLLRENLDIDESVKIFLYQGSLSKGRGIERLLRAWAEMNPPDKALVFMGYGPLETTIKEASSHQSLFFHPAVKPDVLLNYTSSADVGICLIEDTCLSYRYCLPNKMFEYIMAGLPVIASDLIEINKVVREHRIGAVASDISANCLNEAMSQLEAIGQAELSTNLVEASKKYCWEVQEEALLQEYAALYVS